MVPWTSKPYPKKQKNLLNLFFKKMRSRFLIILLFIALFSTVKFTFIPKVNEIMTSKKVLSSDNRIIMLGRFKIYSLKTGPMLGKTQIFTSLSSYPILSLDCFFYDARFIKLDPRNQMEMFVIELNTGGKLMNSLIYQYKDNKLVEIPIQINSSISSIWSSGGTEFKDANGDEILEMFVSHRHYPPEAKKTVE